MTRALRSQLEEAARDLGFAAVGVCAPDAHPELPERLKTFVDQGRHGQMAWMGDRMPWRGNPAALWPEARSIIMLADLYTPDSDPLDDLRRKNCGVISTYARGRDYHDVVKKRLKRLGRWLIEQDANAQIKVFVDTAPVMEKPLAAAAGLGWQGKHTNLVSRDLGNWFFLGAIFTTLDLPKDDAGDDHCGTCRACLDICPTDAFPAPYQLDARRCISYLTIEHKGPVDPGLRAGLGNRIYGCDDCLAVCPWNKFARSATELKYAARATLKTPELVAFAALDDAAFREFFSGSPIKRIGRDRFVRNVAYAIGNTGDPSLAPVVQALTQDADAAVADAARWALDRLAEGANARP